MATRVELEKMEQAAAAARKASMEKFAAGNRLQKTDYTAGRRMAREGEIKMGKAEEMKQAFEKERDAGIQTKVEVHKAFSAAAKGIQGQAKGRPRGKTQGGDDGENKGRGAGMAPSGSSGKRRDEESRDYHPAPTRTPRGPAMGR